MADSDRKVVLLVGDGWIDFMSVVRCGNGLVEVFQQHGEGGVLDLELGFGEIASGDGRTAVVFRGDDFLGEVEESECGLDLAWDIGDFGGEHGSAGDKGRMP